MRIFKVMNSLMKKQFFLILLSIFMGAFTILANVGLLSASSVLISRAALHPEVLDLMVLIVAVRFFGISRGVFRYFERLISHNTTLRMLSGIRSWFYKNFNDNYSENNNKFKTGDIYTKIVNDVDVLKDFYLRGFFPVLIAILTGIITTLFIGYFSVEISIVYLLFYIFAGFVLPVILFKVNKSFSIKEGSLKNQINVLLLDILKGVTETQIYGLKDEFMEKFKKLNKELSSIQKNKNLINSFMDNVLPMLLSLLIVITLALAEKLVEGNKLLDIYYSMLPLTIMASFEALVPLPLAIYKFDETYNSGKNIFTIIDSNSSKAKEYVNKALTNFNLSLKDISVNEGQGYIIKDLSLELPIKKKIAVVGPSGSGKSTLLKVILGFMKYDKGSIKIGDDNYEDIEAEEIRRGFTYVDQKPYTFSTTILENLLIANTEATKEEILNLLDKIQIGQLIEELPEGLDTLLGQYGYNLSGGEIKRLIIARALMKESKVVLLDEPTASLDMKTEKKVVEELHYLLKDKSCIWVTHRLVSMEWMDEILVMDKGIVVERGTHKELLGKAGLYYSLWNMQKNFLNN